MIKKFLLMPIISYVVYLSIQIHRNDSHVISILNIVANMTGFQSIDNTAWIIILNVIAFSILFGISYINYALTILQFIVLFLHIQILDDFEITELSQAFKIVAADIAIIGILLASINQKNQQKVEDETQPKEKQE
ncbi:unnamed protein product [Paramecium sonneborni]|uniref:Uncharacterized protein n=1 Tax=Paramecium sonneborni TaxID=65129 RepID=A0A8S1LVH5_9CILI|nr:unnamed protein product [Paramecium sonneborni]